MSTLETRDHWKEEGKYHFIQALLDWLINQDSQAVWDWVQDTFPDALKEDY